MKNNKNLKNIKEMNEKEKKEFIEAIKKLNTVFMIESYSKQAIDELLEQGRVIEVEVEDDDTVYCDENNKLYKFI